MIVAFCCNDDRGNFSGRVHEVAIGEDIHLRCPRERGVVMRVDGNLVRIGRASFANDGSWRSWFGNIFWEATAMELDEARDLVARLVRVGWLVEQWSEGPFADIVRSAP